MFSIKQNHHIIFNFTHIYIFSNIFNAQKITEEVNIKYVSD